MTSNWNELYIWAKEGDYAIGCCFVAYNTDSWRIQKFHRLEVKSIGWQFSMRVSFDMEEWEENKPDCIGTKPPRLVTGKHRFKFI